MDGMVAQQFHGRREWHLLPPSDGSRFSRRKREAIIKTKECEQAK